MHPLLRKAVEFVKGVLEEELDVQLEKRKMHIRWSGAYRRTSDLSSDSLDQDQSIVVNLSGTDIDLSLIHI
mgnify:CR=1 FL=1